MAAARLEATNIKRRFQTRSAARHAPIARDRRGGLEHPHTEFGTLEAAIAERNRHAARDQRSEVVSGPLTTRPADPNEGAGETHQPVGGAEFIPAVIEYRGAISLPRPIGEDIGAKPPGR